MNGHNRKSTQCFYGCAMTALFLLTGCFGGSDTAGPDTLIPVTGTIMLDGAPASGVALSFVPKQGTTARGGYAVTEASGQFVAKHITEAEGLEPGDYDVLFSKLTMPDGGPIPEGKDAADVGAVESLPKNLTTASETHKYILTVDSSPIEVPFELKSKKR